MKLRALIATFDRYEHRDLPKIGAFTLNPKDARDIEAELFRLSQLSFNLRNDDDPVPVTLLGKAVSVSERVPVGFVSIDLRVDE